jgi:putative ABC transport system ATP-binding protein
MSLLIAKNLTKTYAVDHRTITVLDNVSLSVAAGEFVVIAGSSGSGKTTLLTLLSGLDRPTEGEIWLDGKEIGTASEDDLAPMRGSTIGFVFQSFHLVPAMTALENIMFPAELMKHCNAETRARTLLDMVGLSARADNLPSQLSGGEKQRVALCRAMINQPKLLFADEPTGNLDSKNGRLVLDQLLSLKQSHAVTLVLVTHNPDIAAAADRVYSLNDGRLSRQAGEPETVK